MGFGLSLALAAALTGATTPSGMELEYVIDNEAYQPPGIPGQFFIERTLPLLCDDSVIFAGIAESTPGSALYAATPEGVEVVANENTAMPGTATPFHRAEEPICADGRVLFAGSADTQPSGLLGWSLYSWRRGGAVELELAAGIDFGPIRAYSLRAVQADGGNLVSLASLRQTGFVAGKGLVLKRQSQAPELIFQDFTQTLPGQTEPPSSLHSPFLRGDSVYFSALTGAQWGLYRWSSAEGFSQLLDNQAVHPEIGGNLFSFAITAALDEGLLIGADYSGGSGMFLLRYGGGLEPLMRTGDLTTEGQAIREFSYVRGDASYFTFYGSTVDAPLFVDSIFLRKPDGSIQRILTQGETFDGRLVSTPLAGASGREAAVLVDHGGPSHATTIYRTTLGPAPALVEVPTLTGAALAALAAGLAAAALILLRRS